MFNCSKTCYSIAYTIVFKGHAVRKCVCNSNGHSCKWEEPNMSKCQSLELVYIHDEVRHDKMSTQSIQE